MIARADEELPGVPLLVSFVRRGVLVREETIERMSAGRGASWRRSRQRSASSTARARAIRSRTRRGAEPHSRRWTPASCSRRERIHRGNVVVAVMRVVQTDAEKILPQNGSHADVAKLRQLFRRRWKATSATPWSDRPGGE